MNEFFIQFFKPTSDELSTYYLNQTMVSSLSISQDFIQANGKNISLVLKNPRNIFNSDYTADNSNIFGELIPFYDWRDYIIPDGQFFIAKGTYEDYWNAPDDDRTKRLIGIFRINDVSAEMGQQSVSIKGQDLMKYFQRYVAYHSTNEIWQYPPNNWTDDLMSVGQIIHDVFHKLGVYHYHKDGHIDNDSNGVLTPDGQIFFSTNMYFNPAEPKSDAQIFDMKFAYDFVKTLVNYTGYLFYVKPISINGVPRSVFYFTPPDYSDDTLNLFGASEIKLNNAPTSTHQDPIKVMSINYGKSDNSIRGYVVVSTADSSAAIENVGQSGSLMRDKEHRIGIVKAPDIHDLEINGQKVSSAKAIGWAVMSQIMHLYRSLKISFSNWIKFDQKVYNMAINHDKLNIHINDLYLCKKYTLSFSNGLMITTANFSYYDADEFPKVAPSIYAIGGDGKIGIYFVQVGADKYNIYLDDTVKDTITPTDGAPIDYVITGLTNGTQYTVYVGALFGTQEVLSNSMTITPNPNDGVGGGGGGVAHYE